MRTMALATAATAALTMLVGPAAAAGAGQIGCMNPGTAHIRARGSVPGLSETAELIGAPANGRVLYGVSLRGVIAITPPSACG